MYFMQELKGLEKAEEQVHRVDQMGPIFGVGVGVGRLR
jgi:hypothetical protein